VLRGKTPLKGMRADIKHLIDSTSTSIAPPDGTLPSPSPFTSLDPWFPNLPPLELPLEVEETVNHWRVRWVDGVVLEIASLATKTGERRVQVAQTHLTC
jgi:hypothetical protein